MSESSFSKLFRGPVTAPGSTPPSASAGGGSVGGSNGGAPPLPAAQCRETLRVAGEVGNNFETGTNPRRTDGRGSKQIRLRLPVDFADALLRLPPGSRGLALHLALEGKIGSAFALPDLLQACNALRRVGVLLNQSLRHQRDCTPEVRHALKQIDKLKVNPPEKGGSE